MRRIAGTFLMAAVLLTINPGAVLAQAVDQPPPRRTVLFVNPYHSDLPAAALSEKTLRKEAAGSIDLSLDLYAEYLDLLRFPNPEHREAAFAELARKYRDRTIDAVLLATEQLAELWPRYGIAAGAPTIFFDVNEERLAGMKLPPGYYGVGAVVDYRPVVDWIVELRRPIKRLALVYGTGPVDRMFGAPIGALRDYLADRGVAYEDLSALPFPEVERRVSELGEDSLVLYHLLFQDGAGENRWPLDVLRALSRASGAPVVVGHDQFIGEGALGGFAYSIELQTREAFRLASRFLRGEAGPFPAANVGRGNRFIFDHAVMRRYGFRIEDLPPGALLRNRTLSFTELYTRELIAVIAVLSALTLLVLVLAEQARRLRRARSSLAALNADLESQVARRTADLSWANQRLRTEVEDRSRAERSLSQALSERETLLRELNHRIKNNLQIVLSLIRMSSNEAPGASILDEAAGRIEAIANVHESCTPADGTLIVALDDYLARLCADASELLTGKTRIPIEAKTESGASVPMKTAASIGLIVNELLTNAFKYAYPDGAVGGPVRLSSARSADGSVVVEVADEGVGIDPEAAARPGSLGMGIVHSLADGLGARLELAAAPGKGTRWTLAIPKSD